jgi:hypothetical protein
VEVINHSLLDKPISSRKNRFPQIKLLLILALQWQASIRVKIHMRMSKIIFLCKITPKIASSSDEAVAQIAEEVCCKVYVLEAGSKRSRELRHSEYQW